MHLGPCDGQQAGGRLSVLSEQARDLGRVDSFDLDDLAAGRLSADDSDACSGHPECPGQELDQKRASFASAQANTGAAEANLRRLVQTREYTRIVAPFTGVIACGLPEVRMTSLREEGSSDTVDCFRKRAAHAFAQAFGRRQRIVTPSRLDRPLVAV